LAEHGHETGTCHNCTAPTIGPYCAVCGQERDTHRRSVYNLVRDLIEDIVSFDSRILRTAHGVAAGARGIAKAFREGRTPLHARAQALFLRVARIFPDPEHDRHCADAARGHGHTHQDHPRRQRKLFHAESGL
jgi:hypothetical protein